MAALARPPEKGGDEIRATSAAAEEEAAAAAAGTRESLPEAEGEADGADRFDGTAGVAGAACGARGELAASEMRGDRRHALPPAGRGECDSTA